MNDTTVAPALTPDEWAESQACDGSIIIDADLGLLTLTDTSVGQYDTGVGSISTDRRHAVAALALHGQPFGFTREEYEALTYHIEMERPIGEQAVLAARAVAKIAALLPPNNSGRA